MVACVCLPLCTVVWETPSLLFICQKWSMLLREWFFQIPDNQRRSSRASLALLTRAESASVRAGQYQNPHLAIFTSDIALGSEQGFKAQYMGSSGALGTASQWGAERTRS